MKSPILTSIYRILAVLSFIGMAFCIFAALADPKNVAGSLIYGAGLLMSGIIFLGIAEVVLLIAKIEFNTRESSHEYQILKTLQTIAKNTSKNLNAE